MNPSLTGFGDVLIGSLLVAIGLVAIALALYRRKGTDTLLASFVLFCGLYGVRLILSNPLTPALGVSGTTAIWTNNLLNYVILVPAWYFFWCLLGDGWHRLSYWWVRVLAIFAVIGIASDLVQQTPGSLGTINNIIVILGLIVVILGFWDSRDRITTDLRVLSVGMTIFGLLAINENLVPLGLLPWTWRGETVGFVAYVVCLGWIAARRFVRTERELASVEGELEAAKKIQASILPTAYPQVDSLSIATRFQPSSAVAGDLFDFLTPSSFQVGFVIADVSGHGVPAALIASMVKVAVQSQSNSAGRPADLLSGINQALCGNFQHGFVSLAYLFLDLENKQASVSSGGHPFPFLMRSSEPRVQEVGGSGSILGRFPKAIFDQEIVPMVNGDRWVLYTDGIVEARNADDEMFGEKRLIQSIEKAKDLSAEQLCDSLMGQIENWKGRGPDVALEDDLTLMVVDYLPDE